MTNGERVFDRNQRFGVLTSHRLKCAIEVIRVPYLQRLHLYSQCLTARLRLFEDQRGIWIGRVPKHGHARLATSPLPNGSPAAVITIGIVAVARLAANGARVPAAAMTSTLRRTKSAASSGSRSRRFSA